jgi:hypothetical protein
LKLETRQLKRQQAQYSAVTASTTKLLASILNNNNPQVPKDVADVALRQQAIGHPQKQADQ